MILLNNFQYIAEDGVLTNPQATERVVIFDEKTEVVRRNVTLQLDPDTRIPLLSEDGKFFALVDLRDLPVVLTEDDEGVIPVFVDSDGVVKLRVKKDIYVNYVQLQYGQKASNLNAFVEYLKRTRHVISFLLHDTRASFHVENLDAPINEDFSPVLETDENHVKRFVSHVQEMNGVVTSNGEKLEDGWHLIDDQGRVITEKKFSIEPTSDAGDPDGIAYSIQALQDDSMHRVDHLELETDSVNMLLRTATGWDLISGQRIPLDLFLKRNKMIPFDWTGKNKGSFFMVNEEYELKKFVSLTAYNSQSAVFTTDDHVNYGFNLPLDHYQGAFLSDMTYQKGYDVRSIVVADGKIKITTVNGLFFQSQGEREPVIGHDVTFDYCGIDTVKEDYLFKVKEYEGLEYVNTFISHEQLSRMGISVNCAPEMTCAPLPQYEGHEIKEIREGRDSITFVDTDNHEYIFHRNGQNVAPSPAPNPGGSNTCPALPIFNDKPVVQIKRTTAGGLQFYHDDGSQSSFVPATCPTLPIYNGKHVSAIEPKTNREVIFRYSDGSTSVFKLAAPESGLASKGGSRDLIYAALLGVLATNSTMTNPVLMLTDMAKTDADIIEDGIISENDVDTTSDTHVDNESVF